MAGTEFVIPASKQELRRDEGKGVYVVRQTFDTDELPMVLEGMTTSHPIDSPAYHCSQSIYCTLLAFNSKRRH